MVRLGSSSSACGVPRSILLATVGLLGTQLKRRCSLFSRSIGVSTEPLCPHADTVSFYQECWIKDLLLSPALE
uniref:Uncharacterized protein n=1 Tax=Arundo donax TaxID=35708 RepID=A0A0A9CFI1_ARUDO